MNQRILWYTGHARPQVLSAPPPSQLEVDWKLLVCHGLFSQISLLKLDAWVEGSGNWTPNYLSRLTALCHVQFIEENNLDTQTPLLRRAFHGSRIFPTISSCRQCDVFPDFNSGYDGRPLATNATADRCAAGCMASLFSLLWRPSSIYGSLMLIPSPPPLCSPHKMILA